MAAVNMICTREQTDIPRNKIHISAKIIPIYDYSIARQIKLACETLGKNISNLIQWKLINIHSYFHHKLIRLLAKNS